MTNFTDIRDFLRAHCARYPELALQDVFKALYQSAFGCEHLIADPSAAADYIRAEAARSGDRISELVELLSGDYCRVHLGILQDGLNAETFARLFALSARHEECGREKLEAMLTALQTMADAGELPFSAQETAEAVERWRKDGFPPLHHSEIFRQNYAPAYRVLRRDFARALPLFARIDCLTAEKDRVQRQMCIRDRCLSPSRAAAPAARRRSASCCKMFTAALSSTWTTFSSALSSAQRRASRSPAATSTASAFWKRC